MSKTIFHEFKVQRMKLLIFTQNLSIVSRILDESLELFHLDSIGISKRPFKNARFCIYFLFETFGVFYKLKIKQRI